MTVLNPIAQLQTAIVSALDADPEFTDLVGTGRVTDAPGTSDSLPYVQIASHDVRERSADLVVGYEHRIGFLMWVAGANRAAATDISSALSMALNAANLQMTDFGVTHRHLADSVTRVDAKAGHTRCLTTYVFFTEPKG